MGAASASSMRTGLSRIVAASVAYAALSATSSQAAVRELTARELTDVQPAPLDVEQVHVQVTGQESVAVSWASHGRQQSELAIEEARQGDGGEVVGLSGTLRVIRPNVTWYNYQCGRRFAVNCRLKDIYSSPLLLHANVPVRPSTTYRYRMLGSVELPAGRGENATFWKSFLTPPAPGGGRPLRMAFVGDLGQTVFSGQTCNDLARAHLRDAFDVAVLLGDVSYADSDSPRWDTAMKAFDAHGCSALPWLFLPGNHEIEPDDLSGEPFLHYRRRFRTPQVAPEQVNNDTTIHSWTTYDMSVTYDYGSSFYSIKLGPAHIIVLNPYTDGGETSRQLAWLRQELARVDRTLTPYLLAFTHAPWHTTCMKHQPTVETAQGRLKAAALPLLQDAQADFIFSGHVHAYERSHPIDGIQHFVIGHGGNRERLYNQWNRSAPQPAFRDGEHYGWGELHLTPHAYSWHAHHSQEGTIVDYIPMGTPRKPLTDVGHVIAPTHSAAQAAAAPVPEEEPKRAHGNLGAAAVIVIATLVFAAVSCFCLFRRKGKSGTDAVPFTDTGSPSVLGSRA